MPTPRGLSQAPTSFIGSWYQDIHRLPLVACHKTNNKRQNYATKRCSRPLYSSQNTGRNTSPETTTYRVNTQPQGNNPPRTRHPHQRFGESRPQPPTHPNSQESSVIVTQKNQSTSPRTSRPVGRARFLRTQQRASTFHSHALRVPRTLRRDVQY